MRHTIYLTSGQTAEVVADGPGIVYGASIYFEQDGKEVAWFEKEFVAGVSSDVRPLPSGIKAEAFARLSAETSQWIAQRNAAEPERGRPIEHPIDRATGASSGAKA